MMNDDTQKDKGERDGVFDNANMHILHLLH